MNSSWPSTAPKSSSCVSLSFLPAVPHLIPPPANTPSSPGLATIFGLFLLAAILFAIYASRRAHNETREAGVAVLGRWKENRGMEVPPVPKVPGRAKGSGSGSDRASDAEKGQAGGVKDEKAQMSVGRRLSGLAGIGARGLGVGRGSYEPVPPPPAAGRDTGYSKSAQGPKPPSKDRVPAASKTRTPRSPARSAERIDSRESGKGFWREGEGQKVKVEKRAAGEKS
ncbi:hypothetical protein L198_05453 [Cryptococcus wingfieldii CBS 7118]|uniref:Uncharacterized protein n=1 Tax=Cryptococcus wingfieldii CBS 7118 TaxID=1295528 RepID=A0A1E3IYB3_9TREE|nr:hypothetical protein L198_05453 [Cryptococcus wingfieldii CBS 7118]ODN93584.1 hypothetical protein L198_05453 [Cryptococcus wingfieldii CBS 7118]